MSLPVISLRVHPRLPETHVTPTVLAAKATSYGEYLRKARGFSPGTIQRYESISQEFLDYLGFDGGAESLRNIDGTVAEFSRAILVGFWRALNLQAASVTGRSPAW